MARAERDVFSKHYGDPTKGYSEEEAQRKKETIDAEYGVYRSNANWKPAVIEPDPTKKEGYRVIIERIYRDR